MCIAVRSVKIIPSKYANDVLLKRHDQTTVPARQHMSVAKSSNFNAAEHMKAMHYTATSVVKGRSPMQPVPMPGKESRDSKIVVQMLYKRYVRYWCWLGLQLVQ